VAGVRVVQAHHLQAFVAHGDDGVAVAQHLDAASFQRQPHFIGARPVVVVAQHRDGGRLKASHHFRQLVQVKLAVADEIAGQQDEVGLFAIGQLDGGALHFHRRHAADVLIGEVGDAQVADLIGVSHRPGEPAQLDSVAARGLRRSRRRVRLFRCHACGIGGGLIDGGWCARHERSSV
jgi:hypothetical protein